MTLLDEKREFEAARIRYYLEQAGGKVIEAARLAGIHRTHFHGRMKAHGIRSASRKTSREPKGVPSRADLSPLMKWLTS